MPLSVRLSASVVVALLAATIGRPPLVAAVDGVTLVRSFATGSGSAWNPDSPDPSGLAYIPSTEAELPAERRDRLVSVDGEVEEPTGAGWHSVNAWFAPRSGSAQTATMNTTAVSPKNTEPVGAAYDSTRNELYVSKDGSSGRVWVHNVATGAVVRYFDVNVAPYANADAEGLAFHNGVLYMVDAVDDDLVKVLPGADGIIGRTVQGNDDVVSNFDLRVHGQREPEGLDVHPQTGNIWVVSNWVTSAGVPDPMLEVTPSGDLVSKVSIAAASPDSAGGLAIGPASNGSGTWNIYVADRGVDNNDVATENDGRIYEFSLGAGGTPPSASFTSSQAAGSLTVAFTDTSTGSPAIWSWDFGDGGTSTAQHPSHTYAAPGTYSVTLTASNAFGNSSRTVSVAVAATTVAPTAAFTSSQAAGTLDMIFTDTSTGSPTSWSWDFGDGGTSTAQHPNHAYAAPGTYTVTLTVSNGAGSDDIVGAVSVGAIPTGTNLLLNPGFEIDANSNARPDSWSSNQYFSRSSGTVAAGTYAGRWQSTANNGPASYQDVSVSAGARYTFMGLVNAPATGDSFTFEIKILWRNASGAVSGSVVRKLVDDTNGAWQQVSGTVTAPMGATIARVQMKAGSLNGTIYVDEFRFEAA